MLITFGRSGFDVAIEERDEQGRLVLAVPVTGRVEHKGRDLLPSVGRELGWNRYVLFPWGDPDRGDGWIFKVFYSTEEGAEERSAVLHLIAGRDGSWAGILESSTGWKQALFLPPDLDDTFWTAFERLFIHAKRTG